jgi:MFS family permease
MSAEPDAAPGTPLPRAYWRLWTSTAVDSVGDGAFVAVIPLLTARLTGNPVWVSAVSAAAFLPWLVLSLPVGAIVDRHDRFRLMWRTQLARAILVGAGTALVATDHMTLPVLLVLSVALGVGEVVFGNASQAALPSVVPGPLLNRANGYQGSVNTVGEQFAGPPIGSLLFALAATWAFVLNLVSFVLSAALLRSLPVEPMPVKERPPIREAIRVGLHYLATHRTLRALAATLAVNTFCFAMGTATLVLLATRTLHISTAGYGVLLALAAVGSVLGGVLTPRLLTRVADFHALAAGLAVNVVCFIGIGLATDFAVLAVWLALNGFATTIWNVVSLTYRQRSVPDELRGRVNSVYKMLGWGFIPLGAIVGGLLADWFGLRVPYLAAAGIRALALVGLVPIVLRAMRPTMSGRDQLRPDP